MKAVEDIFACAAQGLPEGWQRAWVTVTEMPGSDSGRAFEGRFQVSMEAKGEPRWDFVPCNARDVAEGVVRLNAFLPPERLRWKMVTLSFQRDGKFELKYDYTP